MLESIDFPEPVIQLAVEPKTKADQEKLGMAIQKLAQEDPTFRVATDPETGQTILSGMGELHLEIIVDRMMREFGVGANVGKPQVAYRETIRTTAEDDYTHKKQTGGSGQYARVKLRVEPHPGEGFRIRQRDPRRHDSQGIHSGRRNGHAEALEGGILAGYPMVGREGDAVSTAAITKWIRRKWRSRSAARSASRKPARKAKPVLLEPIMAVEVVVPEEYMGAVIGDLNSRRGRIEGTEIRGTTQIIKAMVPLSEMFGYATELRSRTQGRGSFTMHFGQYEEVPKASGRRNRGESSRKSNQVRQRELQENSHPWQRKNSIAASRTSTSARSGTSITARPR